MLMGNYWFRLSHMIPNAWFHKLKDMNTITTTNYHKKPPSGSHHSSSTTAAPPPENHLFYHPKTSIYNSHNAPTTSSKGSIVPNRKTIYKPSPKHTESTHIPQDFLHSPVTTQSPSSESTQSRLTSCTCPLSSPEIELQLPPIITKPTSRNQRSVSGVKLKPKSKKNVETSDQTKNLSESLVVVKSSYNPKKDFMQSMMEMITENNIRSDKDLEQLLGCYLSLNSDEYHGVNVKAFEQIWFSLPDL